MHARFELSWSHTKCMLTLLLAAYYNINGVSAVLVYSRVVVYKDLSLRKVEVSYLYGRPTVTVLIWQFQ